MKVKVINKHGLSWCFDSVKEARPHIKKGRLQEYEIIEGVRVYDDKEIDDE